jgi:hypothetical protein
VRRASKGPRDCPVLLVLRNLLALLVTRVSKEPRDLQDPLVRRVSKGPRDLQDPLVRRVSLDLQDLRDRQGLLDLRGQRDQPEVLRHLLRDRRSSLPSSHQTECRRFLRVLLERLDLKASADPVGLRDPLVIRA